MSVKIGIVTAASAMAAVSLTIAVPSVAGAQTTAPPPAGSTRVIPEKSGEPLQSGRSDSLSKELSKSDGVIKPKGDVDPGMHRPAPDPHPNSTPVIPPSATPNGNSAK